MFEQAERLKKTFMQVGAMVEMDVLVASVESQKMSGSSDDSNV